MNVLVAGEFSGTVRNAFRRLGHDAWSCDLIPALDNSPYHIVQDLRTLLDARACQWIDLMIAHPPCDRLLVAGALHFEKWRASGEQQAAIDFFMFLANQPIKRIAIENPVGIMSTLWRKPDQYIEPFEYGHPETKRTCIWLKNLPLLYQTNNVERAMMALPAKERNRIHHESPGMKNGLTRSQRRAVFFQGWADAMAWQWGSQQDE